MSDSPYSIDVTQATFEQEVLERSHHLPVMVDFWADWCGPCKMLMPILATLAQEYDGQFQLAKVDTDKEQELAAANGIRSLPTVRVYKFGQVVDEFMGVQQEPVIREIIERHILKATDHEFAEAMEALKANDEDAAVAKLEQVLQEQNDNRNAAVALAKIYFRRREYAKAEAAMKGLSIATMDDPEVVELKARLEFAHAAGEAPGRSDLEQRITDDGADCQAHYQLGALDVLDGDYEAALEHFFAVMSRDRSFGEDAGRKAMLSVFDILGGAGPLVTRYRAKMASALH